MPLRISQKSASPQVLMDKALKKLSLVGYFRQAALGEKWDTMKLDRAANDKDAITRLKDQL